MTVRVNRPQAYELELLCCYQNILKQNPTEEKRVNKNVLEPIISSSQFSERWNIFLIFRIQCQCKDHIQRSRDVPFQEVGSVPRRGVGVAQQVGLMLVLLPVHWRPVSWWLLRGRHLAPLCWGRSSCPRASLPLASLPPSLSPVHSKHPACIFLHPQESLSFASMDPLLPSVLCQ